MKKWKVQDLRKEHEKGRECEILKNNNLVHFVSNGQILASSDPENQDNSFKITKKDANSILTSNFTKAYLEYDIWVDYWDLEQLKTAKSVIKTKNNYVIIKGLK